MMRTKAMKSIQRCRDYFGEKKAAILYLVALFVVLLAAPSPIVFGQSWNFEAEQNLHQVPAWARVGKIRFGLWYGGILDLAKGVASGWDYYYPADPDMVEASSHWYDPETVEHLRAMNIDWVWVCWSNGFSIKQEEIQWAKLKPYIAACHRQGIHVTGYMSIGNMFWKEMFRDEPRSVNWVLKNEKGDPNLYLGSPNRYMADINNPEWQDYLKKRIDAGLAAGLDGLMYDNTLGIYDRETAERVAGMMLEHAQKQKPDVLFCSNYNRSQLTYGRAQNMITTEDGSVPGFYAADPLPGTGYTYKTSGRPSFAKFGSSHVSADGQTGWLVNNAGLARYLMGVSLGWRPTIIEEGAWNGSNRMTSILPPDQYKLSIAESAAFGFGFETQFLGAFQRDLYFHRPEAIRGAEAIGQYNGFFAKNESLFTAPESVAQTALLCDDTDAALEMLSQLAGKSLIFDVLFSSTLSAIQLEHYPMVALANTHRISDASLSLLQAYVKNGGTLLIAGQSAIEDEDGNKRFQPGFAGLVNTNCKDPGQVKCDFTLGNGKIIYSASGSNEAIHDALASNAASQVLSVEGPGYVICNLIHQPQQNRHVLYVLNYSQTPVRDLNVRIKGSFSNAELVSPDKVSTQVKVTEEGAGFVKVAIPDLDIFDVVVLR
ncbi:MAG: alpha-amylase family protein [Terriglobia bacterium]